MLSHLQTDVSLATDQYSVICLRTIANIIMQTIVKIKDELLDLTRVLGRKSVFERRSTMPLGHIALVCI